MRCECQEPGFCERHQCHKTKNDFRICQKADGVSPALHDKWWTAWEECRVPNQGCEPVNEISKKRRSAATLVSRVAAQTNHSGPGKELTELFKRKYSKYNFKACQLCAALASQMNEWGPDKCKENLSIIVEDILPRAKAVIAENHPKISSMVPGVIQEFAIKERLKSDVLEAIEIARKKEESRPGKKHGRSSHWFHAFRGTERARFVRYEELVADTRELIGKIPADASVIIGVARSGLDVASMVAKQMHLPLYAAAQNRREIVDCGSGFRISSGVRSRGPAVLIDDTVMTGNSQRSVRPWVEERFPNLVSAAVYVNPLATEYPDIWVKDLPWPHLLEWNLFNSILSPNVAVDFDGVLCQNCRPDQDDDGPRYKEFLNGVPPLYLPRRVPIPLIVTARLSKYRPETMAWLKKHNVICKQLVMGPWKNLSERSRSNIPKFKAEYFRKWAMSHSASPPPLMFVESEDWQAREIHKITGRLVVCPSSGVCYQ